MAKLIELRDVYKIYGEGLESEVRALDGVSLDIEKGEFVAVVGQSGSGKSTMMNVLGCLDIPTRGTYRLDGVDVRELSDKELSRIRNKQIGFIFQQYNLIQNLTVLENVELPLIYQGIDPIDRRELARQALARVGLADRAQHKPTQMSGGQQQRVAIARAISTRPPIIMADEPTGALDSRTGHEVLGFLQQLNKEGSTVILITHDNGIAATTKVGRQGLVHETHAVLIHTQRRLPREHPTGMVFELIGAGAANAAEHEIRRNVKIGAQFTRPANAVAIAAVGAPVPHAVEVEFRELFPHFLVVRITARSKNHIFCLDGILVAALLEVHATHAAILGGHEARGRALGAQVDTQFLTALLHHFDGGFADARDIAVFIGAQMPAGV